MCDWVSNLHNLDYGADALQNAFPRPKSCANFPVSLTHTCGRAIGQTLPGASELSLVTRDPAKMLRAAAAERSSKPRRLMIYSRIIMTFKPKCPLPFKTLCRALIPPTAGVNRHRVSGLSTAYPCSLVCRTDILTEVHLGSSCYGDGSFFRLAKFSSLLLNYKKDMNKQRLLYGGHKNSGSNGLIRTNRKLDREKQ